jgi:hypothetical protein
MSRLQQHSTFPIGSEVEIFYYQVQENGLPISPYTCIGPHEKIGNNAIYFPFNFEDTMQNNRIASDDEGTEKNSSLLNSNSEKISSMTSAKVEEKEQKLEKYSPKFWKSYENRRKFMDQLSKKLGYVNLEDWYGIKRSSFSKYGGRYMLKKYYEDAPSNAVMDLYPEHTWHIWRFDPVPRNFWKDVHLHAEYFIWMAARLNIKSPNEWNTKNKEDCGLFSFTRYGSLPMALQKIFPEWRGFNTCNKSISEGHRGVIDAIRASLQTQEVIEVNYYPHNLRRKSTGKKMQLDIYIPSINLAVEYQGEQHYEMTSYFKDKERVGKQRMRDKEKEKACLEAGIKLVQVPYWWDGTCASLVATIIGKYPDLRAFFHCEPSQAIVTEESKNLGKNFIFNS